MVVLNQSTVIDSNAYLGSWPTRWLDCVTPDGLADLASDNDVDLCLVSSLDAIFHRDYVRANRAMDDLLRDHPNLHHVPVANPASPVCPDPGPRVARLAPAAQGFSLARPPCRRLLGNLQSSGGILFISMRMRDERLTSPLLRTRPAETREVSSALAPFHSLPAVINNCKSGEIKALMESTLDNVLFGCEWSFPIGFIEEMVDAHGDARLVFGSNAPLHYYECSLMQIRLADIPKSSKRRILGGNLRTLLGPILA